jgi:hypothetical protein
MRPSRTTRKSRTPSRRVSSDKRSWKNGWLLLVATWVLLLSGVLSEFTGSPGLLQASRLRGLLETKNTELTDLDIQMSKLEGERLRLEGSPLAQEREIRRVLGYAAPGELIFDFSGDFGRLTARR